LIERALNADAYSWAVSAPYAIAFAAVSVEVASMTWRAGSAWRGVATRARIGAAMAAGAFVVGALYTSLLRTLWLTVGRAAPHGLVSFWRSRPVLGVVVAFVAWDGVGWLYHWVGHHTRVGWAAHQPHHSGTTFDMTLGLRQSWAPFHGLAYQPLLAIVGFDFRVIAVCAAVSNCWQVLEHSSAPVRLPGWMASWVMTPAAHRHHHGTDTGARNLGPVLTVWDRLAGTWTAPSAPAPVHYGSVGHESTSTLAIELGGWRTLAADLSSGVRARVVAAHG
jgi:sterol desaturase/sphingolipid hydroxylase (fatty acid hydroxylase superfamily)